MVVNGDKTCHWEFLLPWFLKLKERLTPFDDTRSVHSHPVRIGWDVQDWWIAVRLEDVRNDAATLGGIREALLLVGAFAQLRHDSCWQFLQSFSLFARAPHMDLSERTFVPRFVVDMAEFTYSADSEEEGEQEANATATTSGTSQPVVDVKLVLDVLLSTKEPPSDEFTRDWARVVAMWTIANRVPIDLKPVELRLAIQFQRSTTSTNPYAAGQVTRDLHVITERIQATMKEQHARGHAAVTLSKRFLLGPVFSIARVDLFVFDAELTVADLGALCDLAKVGVSFGSVDLQPAELGANSYDKEKKEAWRWAWRDLLCSLLGQRQCSGDIAATSVKELAVSRRNLKEPMLSALFSVLVGARGIQELLLKRDFPSPEEQREQDGHEPLVETEEQRIADCALWRWMACVLFQETVSPQSLASITMLEYCIQPRVVDYLERFKTGHQHPLMALVDAIDSRDADSAPSPLRPRGTAVTIPAGVGITAISVDGSSTSTLTAPGALSATLLCDAADQSTSVLVLVPGLGICSVDKNVLPAKRQRIDESSRHQQQLTLVPVLRDFVVVTRPTPQLDLRALSQFVELIGSSLRGLGIHFHDVDDTSLRSFLAACPQLENLSVGVTSATSLDVIVDAYASGSNISSLEIQGGHALPDNSTHLQTFLGYLKNPSTAMYKTLRRLRTSWSLQNERDIATVDTMLETNKVLTHFHYALPRYLLGRSQWTIERHHGRRLGDAPRILGDETRTALGHVLAHASATFPASPLNDNVQEIIRDFASSVPWRTVICDVPE